MGQQKDWCSRRSTQVNTGYYLGQSSYLGRNKDMLNTDLFTEGILSKTQGDDGTWIS